MAQMKHGSLLGDVRLRASTSPDDFLATAAREATNGKPERL
jgi:hypothetical protein